MQNDLIQVDLSLLAKWNRPAPRYTSYPTAPQFQPVEEGLLIEKLRIFDAAGKPLSLYFHIPFCKTMCLFCSSSHSLMAVSRHSLASGSSQPFSAVDAEASAAAAPY